MCRSCFVLSPRISENGTVEGGMAGKNVALSGNAEVLQDRKQRRGLVGVLRARLAALVRGTRTLPVCDYGVFKLIAPLSLAPTRFCVNVSVEAAKSFLRKKTKPKQ